MEISSQERLRKECRGEYMSIIKLGKDSKKNEEKIIDENEEINKKFMENQIDGLLKKESAESVVNKQDNCNSDDYLGRLLENVNREINYSEQKLYSLKKNLEENRKKILILNSIKEEKMVFQVKWLVNRIGELKKEPNGMEILEKEIFEFIEKEIRE
jgi:uncharacterized protein with von Willebrand factor type A (vWA) domain